MRTTFRSALGVLACVAIALTAGSALAQPKTLKEQLVGTWTFASARDTNKDGTKTDRWGVNARGLFIFAANGHYSFMIARTNIPKFAINNVLQGTADENTAVVHGVIANIGTWSVDEASKTLTTNIEVGSFPNQNGISQKRVITSLTGDELKYTNSAGSTGVVVDAVWKRVQ